MDFQHLQDVVDVRAMRDLSVRAAYKNWIQPKRDKCVAVNNPGMKGRSKEPFNPFDMGHGVWSLLCWVLVLLWSMNEKIKIK